MVSARACGSRVSNNPEDDVPFNALGNQGFGVAEDRRNFQDERQQDQPQTKGQGDLANEISIENSYHVWARGTPASDAPVTLEYTL